jgi:hypothetical protein
MSKLERSPSWQRQLDEQIAAGRWSSRGLFGLLERPDLANRIGERLSGEDCVKFLADLEALLDGRLVPRVESDDPRLVQAKRLWDKGWGRELGFETFDDYLATIPEIPDFLAADDPELPLLFLADPRLGLTRSCQLLGVRYTEFGYNDESAEPWDARHCDPVEPFWFRCHNGRPNRNRKPVDCWAECRGNRLAGTAIVGLMAYIHKPDIVKEGEWVIDLPGSVFRRTRDYCACLRVWDGRAKLGLLRDARVARPHCGSLVFRREC